MQRMTTEEIVAKYAGWMRSWDASDRTIEARTTLARSRLAAWGLDGFTPDNVQTFLAREKGVNGREPSKWTKATYHAHLKSICEFLVTGGYINASPMDEVRKVRRPRSLPHPLSHSEMTRALESARTHTDRRLLHWITMARRAGLRCHEIAKFSGEDLTERGLFVMGKGEKEAVLPVHAEIVTIARDYPATGYWFPSPYGEHIKADSLSAAVSRFFHDLGIKGSIHRVRHNFGTDLVEGGVDLRAVQELMRHSSLATTEGYTLVTGDRLSAALNRLPAA